MVTDLEQLPRTESGSVRKDDSMRWLEQRDEPSDKEFVKAIVPEPYGETGDRFPKPNSEIRIKGGPEFLETVAGLVKAFADYESVGTRLDIKLQKIKNRETGAETDTWSMYLKAVERGKGRRPNG